MCKNKIKMIQLFILCCRLPPFYPFPLFFFIFSLDFEFDGSPGPLPTVALRTFIICSTTIPPLSGSRMLSALAIASNVVYSRGRSPWLSTCYKTCVLKQITSSVHMLIDPLLVLKQQVRAGKKKRKMNKKVYML